MSWEASALLSGFSLPRPRAGRMSDWETPKTDRLRRLAQTHGWSLPEALGAVLSGPLAGRHTLLAVCPNSSAVARAALRAAIAADAPLLFAATLNQVDVDGGYTGWTPEGLVAFVQEEARQLQADVPILVGLDHGGPWKKDAHVQRSLSLQDAMAAAQRALEACLQAGYALLHLDATADLTLPARTSVPVETLVARTVALMEHAEAYRQRKVLPPVAYEVGTEEVGEKAEGEARFAAFLSQLETARRQRGLPRPLFAVSDVGTTLASADFDEGRARRRAAEAARHGILLKGHYTDGVAHPEAYPLSHVGGANVGPGLAIQEYAALMDLVQLEQRLGYDSGLAEALRRRIVESGRWKKWLTPTETDVRFDALPAARQQWLIQTGSRYVWTDPEISEARQRLYHHVRHHRDADAYVLWRIEQGVLHYAHAFNLVGFNRRLREGLARSEAEERG